MPQRQAALAPEEDDGGVGAVCERRYLGRSGKHRAERITAL
jgi:hypothetical protein